MPPALNRKKADRPKKDRPDRQNDRAARPQAFDPGRPFAEGVRGQESFFIQDGRIFDRTTKKYRGVLDG
ncbi:MAG: hypothetical protein JRC92_06015 [Deltaproteobacteria bacterium]|nr:hypothetical protein [Deltaproteobacteria bacterium]